MPAALLSAKLAVPTLPLEAVSRARLLDRLSRAQTRRLTLVVGPPGAGKTVLLCQWLAVLGDAPSAWLSLDPADNDPVRFWAHLAAALQRIDPAVGTDPKELLNASPGGGTEEFVALLVNDLMALPEPSLLVLDDYHAITNPGIHDAIAYLIEHLPPALHVILSARADPPLPLHRLRVRGHLSEIRQVDLRFEPDEVEAFLAAFGDLQLPREDVALLAEHTEGWAAGLQLAALSLQDRDDRSEFVRDFAGDDRNVADFLLREVLDRQTPQVREFLLATSILERFSAPLCDRLLGREGSQRTLEELERANLFLLWLDDHRGWYRYHHLFAELLRYQLHAHDQRWERQLHRRAATWYEEHGDISRAVHHYLRADDAEEAFSVMMRHAAAYHEAGHGATVREWFHGLPQAFSNSRPDRMLGRAWGLMLAGDPDDAVEWLRRAQRDAGKTTENTRIQADLAGAWAYYWQLVGDCQAMARHAQEAFDLVSEGASADHRIGAAAALWLVNAHAWLDDLPAAHRAYAAAPSGIIEGGRIADVGLPAALSWVAYREGWLGEAMALAEDAVARSDPEQHPNAIGRIDAALTRGAVWREREQMEPAESELSAAEALASREGRVVQTVIARLELAHLRFAQRRERDALAILQSAHRPRPQRPVPQPLARRIDAVEARFRLSLGDYERAATLITSLTPGFSQQVLAARLDMARGATERARRRLEDLEGSSSTTPRRTIQTALLLARVVLQAQRPAQAEKYLRRALQTGEPEGFVRLFLDEGPEIVRLLHRLAARERSAYAFSLLQAAGAIHAGAPAVSVALATPNLAMVEPLSERELTVLGFLPSRLSNLEIADELYVSPNTLKTHLKRIYRKLGVTSRAQAVARAERLQLL